jgi:hypothetical protein
MIRSDRRGDRRNLKKVNRADGIWGWCGNADDALLRIGAARGDLYASLRLCLFRSFGLRMACWNVAVRRRRVCVGVRSVAEVDGSPRERLGACRIRQRCRPRGAVREANVIDAAAARRRTSIRHIEKSAEGVFDPNVLHKCSSIDDSLDPACIEHREANLVCSRRPPVRE